MLTKKEVKDKNLQEGKDYLYIGEIRYQPGESFSCRGQDVTIKRIIDSHHFNAIDGSCWHTGMFYDNDCTHGKYMIPLEYNNYTFRYAEQKMTMKQVFNPDITILHGIGEWEDLGECLIRYDKNAKAYSVETREQIEKNESLHSVLWTVFGAGTEEMMCVLQEWGDGKIMPQSILLDDDNCKKIRYDGFEHTIVEQGLTYNNTDTITLLKRHCFPSQSFAVVKNLVEYDGSYTGETIDEVKGFNIGIAIFKNYAKSKERKNAKESEREL